MNSIVTMPTSITSCLWDENLANFKCFPTVTYKTPGYGKDGKAVVIRTINVNGANTAVTHFGDNTRGILYAGSTSVMMEVYQKEDHGVHVQLNCHSSINIQVTIMNVLEFMLNCMQMGIIRQ